MADGRERKREREEFANAVDWEGARNSYSVYLVYVNQ